jgi:membrane protein
MNALGKTVATVDRTQQRLPWLALPVAVWKKFGDDQAGNLAALIAYYGFVATFPLLLMFVTVLNIVLKNNPTLQHQLLNSALAQYPVIGDQIKNNLHTPNTSGLPLAISIVVLLLGARGVANAIQNALCEVWDIPRADRPGFPWSFLLSMALLFAVGGGLVATTFLSGLAGGLGHVLNGTAAQIGTVAVSLVLNVGVFWLAFRLGTMRRVRWRDLRVGAAIAAVVWQILQLISGYVVKHSLSHASSLYGTFGVVLGLLAWLYLQAEVTLYAAEIDVVLARRLWPRSLKSDNGDSDSGDSADSADSDQKTGTTT